MLKKVSNGTIFPRQDGKIIDEHFGVLHTQQDNFSLAYMTAPPAWCEPAQIAKFDEVVIVVKGILAIDADEQHLEINAGETCLVGKDTWVVYSNASQSLPCEYWSLCMPAFRPEHTTL